MVNIFKKIIEYTKKKYYKLLKSIGGNTQINRDTGKEYETIPKNVSNIKFSEDITHKERAEMVAKSIQNVDAAIYTEPPNVVLESEPNKKPKILTYPQDGDDSGWKYAYYPAGGRTGRRPNIGAIRTWVENTKVGNASNWSLTEEFGEEYGFIGWGFSPEEKKKKIDEVAYLIARKIWYVGRRPSSMNDDQWQKETKDKRPPEGSFNYRGGEKWNNFPYDETYKYESGKVHK